MAKGKRGPGRPNKLRLDWLEPESTFNKHFPNLSQLELEAKHKELYIEAFKKAEAAAGGVLEGRAKVAFKTAFKKKWGALLIPDRRGHYFKGRLGDAPLWRVRYGDKTFVPTIADHATQQQRVWRGQFLTNAGVGTPLSLEQLKRKFIDPFTGLTLSAHHRDGLSEANPYIDDVIAKLVNGQVYQKTKGKYGSLKDVKAGNREFQQFQRVFEKRKIASGDVLEQFDMVMEPLHTKSKPTKMGGGAIHVQQSLEGVSTASGKPLTDKLPDGTIIGDLDPEVRANAYVDEVERIRPIKDRIVKDAIANPDLYPDPFANPPPIQRIKRGKDAGKPVKFWDQPHPAQTLLDNPNIGPEGVRQLTPKQGWPSRLPGGMTPSDTPDPWATIRALNGSDAAPRSVGAAGFGQLEPSTGEGVDLTTIKNRSLDALSLAWENGVPKITRGLRQGQGLVTMGLGYELNDPKTMAVGAFQTGIQTRPVQKQIAKQTIRALNTEVGKAIAERTAKQLGKTGTKAIPIVGDLAIGLPELWNYASRGKWGQAGVSAVSTVVGMVPGKGDLVSAGLDSWNMYRDIAEIKRQLGESPD